MCGQLLSVHVRDEETQALAGAVGELAPGGTVRGLGGCSPIPPVYLGDNRPDMGQKNVE